jgi:hypothetical protein
VNPSNLLFDPILGVFCLKEKGRVKIGNKVGGK